MNPPRTTSARKPLPHVPTSHRQDGPCRRARVGVHGWTTPLDMRTTQPPSPSPLAQSPPRPRHHTASTPSANDFRRLAGMPPASVASSPSAPRRPLRGRLLRCHCVPSASVPPRTGVPRGAGVPPLAGVRRYGAPAQPRRECPSRRRPPSGCRPSWSGRRPPRLPPRPAGFLDQSLILTRI